MFVYLPLPVDESVPPGYRLILAYAKDDTVVVPIEPTALSEDCHNCDWEGCSTLNHVFRMSIHQKYELERLTHINKGISVEPTAELLEKHMKVICALVAIVCEVSREMTGYMGLDLRPEFAQLDKALSDLKSEYADECDHPKDAKRYSETPAPALPDNQEIRGV